MSKQVKKLDESMGNFHQITTTQRDKNRLSLSTGRNPADDYLFDILKNPFISPLYASDEMLKQMPPMKIVVCFFKCSFFKPFGEKELINSLPLQAVDNDPFVDDSVTMAKRLKALGKSVGLDVLPGKFFALKSSFFCYNLTRSNCKEKL